MPRKIEHGPLSRRDVITMLAAGAAAFQARAALGQTSTATATVTPTVTATPTAWQPTAAALKNGLLSSLVSDLIRNPKLRRRFNRDPQGVVESYDLTEAQKAAFYAMKQNAMHTFMKDETTDWLLAFKNDLDFAEVWNYDDQATDPTSCDDTNTASYPSPLPKIFRFRPLTVAVGGPQTLSVFGQSFAPDATLVLDPPVDVTVVTQRITGTFRSSRLFATVDAKKAGADQYTLKLMRGATELTTFTKCKLSVS
ncbi:MAG: hypothetical protein SF182_16990 [Deltaproteobacteria bacterium]|nr:hypothetical protein [Deltaproteobacteria bacterium]